MINLLPPEIKEQNKFARYNVTLLQYALLVIILTASLIAVLGFGVIIVTRDESALRKAIASKEQTLSQLEPDLKKAEELSKKIDLIGKLLERNIQFSELIPKIGSLVPNGASLTALSLTGDSDRPLQIQAVVKDEQTAAILRENLENSNLFSLADIQSINAGETQGSRVLNYTVSIVVQFADPKLLTEESL